MVTTAFVKVWGKVVGAVAWDENEGLARFEYDPDFFRSGWELAPLKMPVSTGGVFMFPELRSSRGGEYDTFKGLPGLLADILPDKYGNRLLNAWLARNGRPENSMNPVEQLCFIGTRGMGALEFEPAAFMRNNRAFDIEIGDLVETAHKILDQKRAFGTRLAENEKSAMMDILKIGTSAGGARPKAIITYNKESGKVKSGQVEAPDGFEHWIIKLDGVSDEQFGATHGYGRVEMAYYGMALNCGIDMMESRLLEESGRAHFMTRRFDRERSEQKHHIQTLCAMQHFDFNDVNSYSYEQLFQTMRALRLPYPQAEQMFRRVVFNVLARNCDDHTKNFAFRLKEDQAWELAPAYDLCHAYRPDSPWVSRHALSINGKRDGITRDDFLSLAKSMNIKKASRLITLIGEVVGQWRDYAEEAKVDPLLRDSIQDTLLKS